MGRDAYLSNEDNRDALLEALRKGHTMQSAALSLGISRRSVRRFCNQHPDFEVQIDAAKAAAVGKLPPVDDGVAPAARIVQRSITEAVKAGDVFTSASKQAADDGAEDTPDEGPPVRTRKGKRPWSRGQLHPNLDMRGLQAGPDVPELIEWLWGVSRGVTEVPDGVRSTALKALCDVKFKPLLAELKLQQMVAARRRERAEEAQDVTEASLVILEIPSNGTEAPGYAPRSDGRLVVDAEVVE